MTPNQLAGWNGIAMVLRPYHRPGELADWCQNYARERVQQHLHALQDNPDSYEAGSVRAAIHFLKAGTIQERQS